ncbi:hypothetical protein ON010_g12181 [Phytophthora cinnamomi]|nr:hypothetical protein ON010_g12181 [Phytophthora cinnamomi]
MVPSPDNSRQLSLGRGSTYVDVVIVHRAVRRRVEPGVAGHARQHLRRPNHFFVLGMRTDPAEHALGASRHVLHQPTSQRNSASAGGYQRVRGGAATVTTARAIHSSVRHRSCITLPKQQLTHDNLALHASPREPLAKVSQTHLPVVPGGERLEAMQQVLCKSGCSPPRNELSAHDVHELCILQLSGAADAAALPELLTDARASATAVQPKYTMRQASQAARPEATSRNLSRHKRLHGKIDPLSCPIDGCICAFPSTNKLERHLKFHYGGDVKVCHVEACGRTFSTTGNLNRHIKKHHGGVGSPSAVSSVTTTRTQEDDVKSSAKSWTMCSTSGESDADSDASTEQWWSSPSTPGTSAATFDCVWSDDLLATLASILDDGAEPVKQQQPQQC